MARFPGPVRFTTLVSLLNGVTAAAMTLLARLDVRRPLPDRPAPTLARF